MCSTRVEWESITKFSSSLSSTVEKETRIRALLENLGIEDGTSIMARRLKMIQMNN